MKDFADRGSSQCQDPGGGEKLGAFKGQKGGSGVEQVGERRVAGEEPEGEEVGPGLAGCFLGFLPIAIGSRMGLSDLM